MIRSEYPDKFNELWLLWPGGKRGGKKAALKAWNQLEVNDEDADFLISHVKERIANDKNWIEGVYIFHVSTFLNQERWDDDDWRHAPVNKIAVGRRAL